MAGPATGARWVRRVAAVAALAVLAAACGGGGDDDTGGGGAGDEGTPTPGGRVVYGLEAETIDGWCLPEAQLAIAGIMVARTIYDTLTRPTSEGTYEPWLAESVEPNDDYTEWTITLREGVTFHDGSELNAEVVKNNLDAYRGQYPTREPLLFTFVFDNVANVEVVDPMSVRVTMNEPWVDFDAYLWGSGRLGIMAQAQLDDTRTCAENLIGTGPFMIQEWVPNQRLVAEKNPDYWATDDEGNQLPYLDEIEFRPIVEVSQRLNALQSGEINAMHTSDPETITELHNQRDAGSINLTETTDFGEVTYTLLNTSRPPFDNPIARQAVAHATDFEEYNSIIGHDLLTQASGPFAPGNVGNLDDTGFPTYDPEEAEQLVQQYEDETGQPLRFTYTTTQAEATIRAGQLLEQQWEEVGMEVDIVTVDQSTQIDTAISGDFQAIAWRNHPGGDPDTQYVWWESSYPTNFGRINDPEIDRLLNEGRTTPDPDERQQIYENLNRRFGEQAYNLWLSYTLWSVATAPDVHGVDAGAGLAVGHPVETLWVEQ
ncbi:MAG TPA: ABC transporter substrate-binding protein [Acidimicrobiales bacterium]